MSRWASYLLPTERLVLKNAEAGRPLLSGWELDPVFKSESAAAYKDLVAARDLLRRCGCLSPADMLTDKGRQALVHADG